MTRAQLEEIRGRLDAMDRNGFLNPTTCYQLARRLLAHIDEERRQPRLLDITEDEEGSCQKS